MYCAMQHPAFFREFLKQCDAVIKQCQSPVVAGVCHDKDSKVHALAIALDSSGGHGNAASVRSHGWLH